MERNMRILFPLRINRGVGKTLKITAATLAIAAIAVQNVIEFKKSILTLRLQTQANWRPTAKLLANIQKHPNQDAIQSIFDLAFP
jgi:endonuclease/exonuclease/phosphatase (EEP) superfamily protein YafD